MRLARLIGPELEALLHDNPEGVRELLDEIHPEDIADIIDELDDTRATELLTELPAEYAAQVFSRIDEDRQTELAETMGLGSTALIAVEMDGDDRTDFYSELPPDMGQQLLKELEKVDPEAAEEVEELARWPETSAGGLMTTGYWSAPHDGLMSDALAAIRQHADESVVQDVVYVLDEEAGLLGFLTIRDLVVAHPNDPIAEQMRRNLVTVPPEMDQEEVARVMGKYDLSALPVVDPRGAMLGVVTPDDIIDVIEEEANEDVHKMAAVQPLDDAYFDVTFLTFLKKRAPWLVVLFMGGFLTAWAMKSFQGVLSSVAELSFYVPLLISAGGNSGSQSSSLIIRGLAVGDVSTSDWWRVLLREATQGLTMGGLLALLGAARVLLSGSAPTMALLIGVTIVCIVTLGCLTGAMMPLVLHRVGLDPATSSTPFIATLIDVLGILIYLSLATWFLGDILRQAAGG